MNIYHSFNELVGNTPVLQVHQIEKEKELKSHLFVKIESYNPAGSIKDRVARQIILDALKEGKIKEGATIIEATSGNTGIGLCAVGATLGFNVIIIMPDTMSKERITLMKAYGAEVILTPGHLGMQGCIDKANELANTIDNSFIAGQFENMSNPSAHYIYTGKELDEQMDGQIDILVAGIGTGGTISGLSLYLKEKHPNIKIVGVEPYDSPLLTKGYASSHKIQGIGANFIPQTLDQNAYDELYLIKTQEAYDACRLLARKEGILSGISSGGALHVGIELAKIYEGLNIVVILPDGGDRYLSTDLYE